MVSEIAYKKLLWHSRRGMWELDILLLPFAETCLPTLPLASQQVYERLLAEEDQDLFACLVDRVEHPDPELREMVAQIRAFASREKNMPH